MPNITGKKTYQETLLEQSEMGAADARGKALDLLNVDLAADMAREAMQGRDAPVSVCWAAEAAVVGAVCAKRFGRDK